MTANRSIRAINLSTALLLLGGTAGCGDVPPGDDPTTPAADTTSIAAKLSPVARKMALENQVQYQQAGLKLAGRVWFAPDAYGEIYDDTNPEPEGFAHFVARGNSQIAMEAALHPREEESVDEYVARTRPGLTPVRFDLESGARAANALDVLLFQPAPAAASAGDVTTVTSALGNEFCPIDFMNFLCGFNYGWNGSSVVASWAIPGVFGGTTGGQTGTSFKAAVCADFGSATMKILRNNVVKSTTNVAQGFADWHGHHGSWAEIKWCSWGAEPFCFDYHYSTNYFRYAWKQQITTTGNAHICGEIKNHTDRVLDNTCTVGNNCPKGVWGP